MIRQLCAALLALVLIVCFSTITRSQDMAKQETKKESKMEMTKAEKKMGPLKSVSCDPTCGFMCRSHDEKELTSIVKSHAKKVHKMEMTDKQVKEMMKTEEAAETPKQ